MGQAETSMGWGTLIWGGGTLWGHQDGARRTPGWGRGTLGWGGGTPRWGGGTVGRHRDGVEGHQGDTKIGCRDTGGTPRWGGGHWDGARDAKMRGRGHRDTGMGRGDTKMVQGGTRMGQEGHRDTKMGWGTPGWGRGTPGSGGALCRWLCPGQAPWPPRDAHLSFCLLDLPLQLLGDHLPPVGTRGQKEMAAGPGRGHGARAGARGPAPVAQTSRRWQPGGRCRCRCPGTRLLSGWSSGSEGGEGGGQMWGGEGDTADPKARPLPVPVPVPPPLRTSREVKRAKRGSAQLPLCRLSGKRWNRATFMAYMLEMEPPARGQGHPCHSRGPATTGGDGDEPPPARTGMGMSHH